MHSLLYWIQKFYNRRQSTYATLIQSYFTIFAVNRYGSGYYYIEEKVLRKTYQDDNNRYG